MRFWSNSNDSSGWPNLLGNILKEHRAIDGLLWELTAIFVIQYCWVLADCISGNSRRIQVCLGRFTWIFCQANVTLQVTDFELGGVVWKFNNSLLLSSHDFLSKVFFVYVFLSMKLWDCGWCGELIMWDKPNFATFVYKVLLGIAVNCHKWQHKEHQKV